MKQEYRVIVPCTPRKVGRRITERVSYPPSGHSLYTKDEARTVLARFPTSMGAYAESSTERFDNVSIISNSTI